ncbi:MAG TPA: ABC transporter substrate-binding protein, partial [Methylophilaceae bacterium]|nr:ABC transporter substrate-binding protein [Methylophilaceae bacterium]
MTTAKNNDKPAMRLLTGAFILSCLVSCTQPKDAQKVDYDKAYPVESGGSLVEATRGEPSGLIPMIAGESAASAVAANIFNTLLKYDKNLDIEGDLAQSWEVSQDQKTITFKLKPGMKWADGQPLTSADALFTWKLVT